MRNEKITEIVPCRRFISNSIRIFVLISTEIRRKQTVKIPNAADHRKMARKNRKPFSAQKRLNRFTVQINHSMCRIFYLLRINQRVRNTNMSTGHGIWPYHNCSGTPNSMLAEKWKWWAKMNKFIRNQSPTKPNAVGKSNLSKSTSVKWDDKPHELASRQLTISWWITVSDQQTMNKTVQWKNSAFFSRHTQARGSGFSYLKSGFSLPKNIYRISNRLCAIWMDDKRWIAPKALVSFSHVDRRMTFFPLSEVNRTQTNGRKSFNRNSICSLTTFNRFENILQLLRLTENKRKTKWKCMQTFKHVN